MSAFGMTPTFNDRASYSAWLRTWRMTFREISKDIRSKRAKLVELQRADSLAGTNFTDVTRRAQRDLHYARRVANKMLTLRDEAKLRWERISAMERDLAEQNALFPLDLGECKRIDFHFNKISIEFPFMPGWVIKTKGKSFYVRDVISTVGFSTRNKAEGNTRGLLRFPSGFVHIDADGVAHITPEQKANAGEKMVDRIMEAA